MGRESKKGGTYGYMGFPVVLMVKNLPANVADIKRHRFSPWIRKILWRRA